MFAKLLSIEVRKVARHPILWLEFAALILLFAVYFAVRYLSTGSDLVQTQGVEHDLQAGLALFSIFNILFYAAAGGFISSYDYPERGIQMWLVRGVPRPLVIAARLAVSLMMGFVLAAAALLVILSLSGVFRMILLGTVSVENLDWVQLLPTLLRIFWAAVPYLALTSFLAVVSRSPIFTVGGAIVFRTIVEILLENFSTRFPHLIRFLPGHLETVLQVNTYALDRTAQAAPLSGAYLTEPQAIGAVGVWLVVLLGLSIIVFSRQDWGG